jgi:hypothetical protein
MATPTAAQIDEWFTAANGSMIATLAGARDRIQTVLDGGGPPSLAARDILIRERDRYQQFIEVVSALQARL